MNCIDLWGLTASDQKQTNRYYDNYGSSSSNPYVVTGCNIGESADPYQVNIDIVFSSEKNGNGATKGTLTVYWATYSEVQKGYKGTAVVSVPVVSGGNGFNPTPAGTYTNLKAEKTSTSNNEVLKNTEHGGDNNLMVRLPNTDGDAIHEGNINSNIERAYTEGCTAVTADPNDENLSNVSDNYNAFKKAIQPYGNTEININATVRYN